MADKRFGGRRGTSRRKDGRNHPKPDAGTSSGPAESGKRSSIRGSWNVWSKHRTEVRSTSAESNGIHSILARYPFTLEPNSHREYRLWPNDTEEEMTPKVHSTSQHFDHGRTEYGPRDSYYFRNLHEQQKNKEEPTASMALENLPPAMQNLHIRTAINPSPRMLKPEVAMVRPAHYPIIRPPFVPTKETSPMPMMTAKPISVIARQMRPMTTSNNPIIQNPPMSTMMRSSLQLPLGAQMSSMSLGSPIPSLAGPSRAQTSPMLFGSTAPVFAGSPQQLPLGAQTPLIQSGLRASAFSRPPAPAFARSPVPTFERPPVPLVRAPPGFAPITPVLAQSVVSSFIPMETAPEPCRQAINETASTVLASTLGIYQYINDD